VDTVIGTTSLTVPGFVPTGSLVTARAGATAIPLNNGLVLVAGGMDSGSNPLASAELYNPATGTFSATGSLNAPRASHTATLLTNGTVLIAGGYNMSGGNVVLSASAELYDPVAGTFTTTGSLVAGAVNPTATLLANGKVLIAGGSDANVNALSIAELYDPSTGTFAAAGSLNVSRTFDTATLLANGKVLIAGGYDQNGNNVASAELYDPVAGSFATISAMNTARFGHTATLLNSGQVLLAGGLDQNINTLASAELYDPVAGTFTLTGSLSESRCQPTATLLNDGQVLFVGGTDQWVIVADAELYDPVAGTFTATGNPTVARYMQTATLLNNGTVLVAGGSSANSTVFSSAELYQPTTLVQPNLVSIAVSPLNPSIPAGTAQSLTATGTLSDNSTQTTASVTWSSSDTTIATVSSDSGNHGIVFGVATGAVTVSACTGQICGSTTVVVVAPAPVIAGLSPSSGPVGSSLTISGNGFGAIQGSSTITFNGTMASVTSWSTTSITVTVPNGATTGPVVVTVSGVASNSVSFSVLSLVAAPTIINLSPTSGAVGTSVTIMGTSFGATQGTSTVTLNNASVPVTTWNDTQIVVTVPSGATTGNVVVTVNGVASNGVSFVVQPGSFVATTGQMGASRYGQTATQLTTGRVLITGGMSTSGVVNSTELYTPASQAFAPANPMNVARWLHTATLLNDGTVLVAGGSDLANQETLDTAEIYDPVAGTFTLLSGTLNTARVGHTATLLANGQVLIVGGYDPATGIIADAELYDPTAQEFIDLGNTNTPRFRHTATLLQNGQVLIAGGETDPTPSGAYNTAEIFNPATGAFTVLPASMTTAREGHVATLLNNGKVLITGGDLPGTGSLNTAEIYDPSANTFTAVPSPMTTPRIYHDAILLNGGKVLLSGGETDSGGNSTALNSAEVYDPTSLTFTAVPGNMTSVREHQTATLLNDGTVLEDGGTDGPNVFNTAEIYTTSKLAGLTSIAVSPASPSVPIGAQQLLIAVGTFSDGSTQVLSSALWSSSSPNVSAVSNDASNSGFATSAAQGTATMTATAAGISGSATVTVTAPALVSIALSPQSPTMPLGTTQQFTATGTYSDGSAQDLTSTATWTSSSSSVTVSSAGLATAVSLGNSLIQASSGSISASTNVTVSAPALVSLALSPSTATISVRTSQQFQVIGTYTDGSINNLTNLMSWFAVPSETASVNAAGLATGVGQGTATITASNGTLFAVGSITVQAQAAPSLVAVVVTPSQASIPIGSGQQFIATGNYSDGSTQDLTSSVTWTSSSNGVASVNVFGLATAASQGSSTLTATSGSLIGSATISVTASALSLNTSRYQHSATLLNNGTVLIAGGVNCASAGSCTYLNSAELYNPNTGTITYTGGGLAVARSAPAALLGNGKVLVAGGYNCDANGNCASLKSAEVYDPNSNSFSSAGDMTIDRYGHTMTPLANGKVLIAGGETCSSSTSCTALSSAELYDPVAGSFTGIVPLNAARFNASAAFMPDSGKVLIVGGFNGSTYPAAAELYDPVAGTFSTGGSLNTPRANATAAWLENSGDMVLIAGGSTCNSPGCPTASTEYYQNGYFYFLGDMTVPRLNQTATLLTNGQLYLAGGFDSCISSCVSDATSELYNPQTYSFTSSQALTAGRSGHTATLLTDGSVLLVGGINNGVTLASTNSYQPSSLALPEITSITITPSSSPLAVGSTLTLVATGYLNSNSLGTLQPVIWNSSSPSVASVSNAAGSAGIVNALSAGTTTITASLGTISATAQITVTPVLLSITVTPPNPSTALNSSQLLQLTATGNYSDGSSNNLTPYVTWNNSNSSVAKLMLNLIGPSTEVVVIPVGAGNTSFTAAFGGLSGSTTVSVLAPPTVVAPNILAISPTTGSAGTQVTINGSGFGASQGTGTVWLGTTLGTVVSWSDSQVIASVNTGSTSGAAQIMQGGVASNAVPFTVNSATISSVTPTSGIAGTQVTITGSGFGATQGSGIVQLGNTAGVVTSWSDGQVVATVAPGSASGTAQILQNGVWSNSVPFAINLPHIASISPNSGAGGTAVTITGNGFGATQGSGAAWIGSTDGVVTSWSDTQVVASVASSASSGIVKIQQNGTWSNAVTFTVPGGGGTATPVSIAPNIVTMLANGTQATQVLDASGQPVTGLTWTSSNPAVATLSSDDPPMITAVGPGNATITAGNASIDVTVPPGNTLSTGAVTCANPGDGSGVVSIIPAVPSPSGVADVFALQADGNVRAITTNCLAAWTAFVGTNSTLIPDFQGGLIVASYNGQSVYKLDGITGQAYPAYTASSGSWLQTTPVPHTDGTIFTVDGDQLVGINPLTGQPRFSVQMNDSTSSVIGISSGEFCYGSPLPQGSGGLSPGSSFPHVGPLMIAGDGYAYVPYSFGTYTFVSEGIPDPITRLCTSISTTTTTGSLRLLRVGTAGDSYEFPLGDWSSFSFNDEGSVTQSAPLPSILLWMPPITNGDTGVLYSWSLETGGSAPTCPPGAQFGSGCVFPNTTVNLTTTSGTSMAQATINIPGGSLQPVLQRADDSYIGADAYGTNMYAFTSSGQLLWTVPNDFPMIATSDGGVIGYSGITYDQNGKANGRVGPLPIYSWKGAYELGSTESVMPAFDLANMASTFTSTPGGNLTGNGFSLRTHTFGIVFCGPGFKIGDAWHGGDGSCVDIPNMNFSYIAGIDDTDTTCPNSLKDPTTNLPLPCTLDFSHAYPAQADAIKIMALNAYKAAFANLPAIVQGAGPVDLQGGPSPVTKFEHTIYVRGDWLGPGVFPRTWNLSAPPTGWTPLFSKDHSYVYYLPIMGNAQTELGYPLPYPADWYYIRPSYPPVTSQDVTEFGILCAGIGRAIGNVAAHETAWELNNTFVNTTTGPFPYMECTPGNSVSSNCPGTGSFYQQDSTPTAAYSGTPNMSWGTQAQCYIEQYLIPGYDCKNANQQ
jgi:N-acetylneuraminic acid mutarotase